MTEAPQSLINLANKLFCAVFLTNRSILRRCNRPLLCLRAATSGRSENNTFTLYTIHSQLAICLLYCHLFYKYIIQDSVLSNESRRFPAWKPTFGCGKKKNQSLNSRKKIYFKETRRLNQLKQTVLLIIIIFHSFAFLLLFAFYLMSYLMSIFYPRLFQIRTNGLSNHDLSTFRSTKHQESW